MIAAPIIEIQEKERHDLFASLYERAFPMVAKFIRGRNGSLAEAQDIFQDALVIFYEKMLAGHIDLRVSEEAYITGIARHLWLKEHKQEARFISLDTFDQGIAIPDEYFAPVKETSLLSFLADAGRKCMDLLQAVYYKRSSLAELARVFGYSSTHSATVQKFKCLEKVRNKVKERKLHYEDFTE